MSATIALVRIQLHFLKWPLVVLTGCVIAWVVPVGLPKDAIEVFTATFVIIGAVVSGAMVFGEEYAKGADGYIATRPVAPMHVLSVKVLMLLAYSIPAAWIVDEGLSFLYVDMGPIKYESLVALIWGLLFGLSLWCAGAAILTKDTVRGILYGPATYIVCAAMLFLVLKLVNPITMEEYQGTRSLYLDYLQDLFLVSVVFFSPLFIIGLVICIYRSIAFQRLTVPVTGGVFIVLYLSITYAAWSGFHFDVLPADRLIRGGATLDIDRTHQRLYTVDSPYKEFMRDPAKTVKISVRNLFDPSHVIYSFEAPWDNYERLSDYIHDDRYYVKVREHDNGSSYMDVHPINTIGDLEKPLRIEAPKALGAIRYFDPDRILTTQYNLDESGKVSWNEEYVTELINLNSGMVEAATHEQKKMTWWSSYGRLFWRDQVIGSSNENRIIKTISWMNDDLSLKNILPINKPLGPINAIYKDTLVYIPSEYTINDDRKVLEDNMIITDIRDPDSIKQNTVHLPLSLYHIPVAVHRILTALGLKAKEQTFIGKGFSESPSILASDGIVCVTHNKRTAVWDISKPDSPKWLGFIPFDNQVNGLCRKPKIFRYPDGAIGIVSKYKDGFNSIIYRYEFPALMKEAKS